MSHCASTLVRREKIAKSSFVSTTTESASRQNITRAFSKSSNVCIPMMNTPAPESAWPRSKSRSKNWVEPCGWSPKWEREVPFVCACEDRELLPEQYYVDGNF